MKQIFSSPDFTLVSQLKGILELEGIPCMVKNEVVSFLAGEVPFTEAFPELWVNDTDFDRACELKRDWKAPGQVSALAWECPNCRERLEAQFSSCWKCGVPRPAEIALA